MNLPLISCIVPIYNSERYLRRCIDSILAQDYPHYEIILVDDGSTDSSSRICDQYAAQYKSIIVYHKRNEGASLARKYGLDRATGDFVSFIDSDDWILPQYLSTLYQMISQYDVKISACGVHRVKPEESTKLSKECYESQLLTFDELMPRFFKYEFWGFWGKLYYKDVFGRITFPEETLSEDYYVMTQVFSQEQKMAFTNAQLYYYEYHLCSLSHEKLSQRAFGEFENVKSVYEFTRHNCPQYKEYALSNVIETSVKLYLQKTQDRKHLYTAQFNTIRSFLKKEFLAILHNHIVNKNIRILAIGIVLFPSLIISLIKIRNKQ